MDDVPGARAREWVGFHNKYAATSTYVYEFVWDVTRDAAGPFCRDVDGNTYLDFTSHVGSAPLGYNNSFVLEKLREFGVVDPVKIAGQDLYASMGWPPSDPELPGAPQLMERLVDVTSHFGMDTVFLSNSGAEAVENAIKICYDYSEGGKYGFTFRGAFHGRTLGALSLNRSKAVHRKHYPEISTIHSLPYCNDSDCSPGSCGCGFFTENGSVLREMLGEGGMVDPREVAYVVLEPVQGEGGYRVPSKEFIRELEEVCREHEILIVADEIQCGVGRTGEMWGSDHYGLDPDVLASAKALRVGATVGREEVFPDEEGRISSTWGGGDMLACLQGCVTLDVVREEDLLDNARERGRQFKELVRDWGSDHVVDVRGLGLMIGVELSTKEERDSVVTEAFRHGLLTLACGHKTLRLMPPLDVTEREINIGVEVLKEAIHEVE